ncbi:DNA topoisomerase III [Pseudomonas sp. M47T1]|uniref:DNA topoisomerase III n=1 Tax=Pseudomonas sp. M47T1 TaxID=1179778 RepID=UPI0002608363|nr:DNA topoisomerase III [Pseudomonas sp. M47T1]EIK93764.1 DNA topoisomerase III [Pseudomonas sp. M47T1]
MQLFICEKPSQARDIARVLQAGRRAEGCLLGAGVTVTWCVGHLLETAPPETYGSHLKRWALEDLPILPQQWKVLPKPKVASQLKVIRGLLGRCGEVVIATDADREGEMIAREILELEGYRGPVQRLWLSALNDASIRQALAALKPGAETLPLYHSALARSRADWLVGINLSRLFTLLGRRAGYDGVLPVGRVQTPTLKLVVARDRAIASFVAQPYWTLDIRVAAGAADFQARWQPSPTVSDDQGRCTQQSAAHQVLKRVLEAAQVHTDSVESERVRESAPLPFDLGTLQEICSARLGLGAQETLECAQALYETHKVTSYPRSDCGYLPESMIEDAPTVLEALTQADPTLRDRIQDLNLSVRSRAWNTAKISAHHGIIPTAVAFRIDSLPPRERAVYALIRARYMAQFCALHEYLKTEALFIGAGETFKAAGKQILVPGWKPWINEADPTGQADASQALPALHEGYTLTVCSAKVDARTTQPTKPYTEGTLIRAMKSIANQIEDPRLRQRLKDSIGIGTEATRASILQGLIDHGYLVKKKRSLSASAAGHTLIEAVPPEVADPVMTALWEQALEHIETGRLTVDAFLFKQGEWLSQVIKHYATLKLNVPAARGPGCPICKTVMRKRTGRTGTFWSCSRYPDCKGTKPLAKPKASKPKSKGP